MMNKFIKSQKIRYGGVALILTLLVLVAVIIANVIVAALASRYEWMYIDMNDHAVYNISDDCKEYLSDVVFSEVDKVNAAAGTKEKITIIFCDDKDSIVAEQSQKYIHDSVYELDELFPGYINIQYLNIWEDPTTARSYGVTSSTDVVCSFNGSHETMNLQDFYVFEAANSSSPIGYNGEKIIASCLMRVTQGESPMCYITANHGETFEDYEFMRTIVEAGYTIGFLDLSVNEIPEDCDLLITFDPKQDLIVSDSVSGVSEVDKINAFMNQGGKYMVFLSTDTFASGPRKNLEGFLSEWGIAYRHETAKEGHEDCYLIRDTANSLSVDGYTILAQTPSSGLGADIMADLDGSNVFGRSTAIYFTSEYKSDNKGNFVMNANGVNRTAFPLMVSHGSAEAWVSGRAVARASEDPFVLMAMSTQKCDNGETSYVIACASTAFAGEDSMQSTVLDNSKTLTGLLSYMGKSNAPVKLVYKPFQTYQIESLTTFNANLITTILAVAPAIICLFAGIFVLVRRKNS